MRSSIAEYYSLRESWNVHKIYNQAYMMKLSNVNNRHQNILDESYRSENECNYP